MKQYALCADIGGTTLKTALISIEGDLEEVAKACGARIEAMEQVPTDLSEDGAHIPADIAGAFARLLKSRGLAVEDVAGIGMGAPGAVIDQSIVNHCVNLGWGVVPLADRMRELTGVGTILVENDANLAALGEIWAGAGAGFHSAVMLTIGTGIGGGIILNGRILSGEHGAAGEIGHMHMVDGETMTCGCGNHGCLEQYAAAPGIVRAAKSRLAKRNDSVLSSIPDFTAKDVFDAARSGDRLALDVVNQTAEMLGTALSYISCVFDPQIFLIGGGISKAGPILLEPIEKSFRIHAFHASRETEIRVCELENYAGVWGCAKLAFTESR